jgi:hypothetical protein
LDSVRVRGHCALPGKHGDFAHNRFARNAVGKLLPEDDGEPVGMAADRQVGH